MIVTTLPPPERIESLADAELTIAELLAFFGYRIRNFESVPVIDAALQSVGLTTDPPFSRCRRAEKMKVVTQGTVEVPDEDAPDDETDSKALPQRPFRVSDLPTSTAGLTSVCSDDTLQKALHTMQTEGLSQIPVIDGSSSLKGIVTWRSVAAMYLRSGVEPSLTSAIEPAQTVELHLDLFRELPRLDEHGYLLVRDNDGNLTGIITAADITKRFHDTALPYFLVGEIESRLRTCLGRLSPEAISTVLKNKSSIDGLVFGQYLNLLRPQSDKFVAGVEANWRALGWHGIDRTMFIDHLDKVKSIRNSIAHFHPTPPTQEEVDELRKFSSLLKTLM